MTEADFSMLAQDLGEPAGDLSFLIGQVVPDRARDSGRSAVALLLEGRLAGGGDGHDDLSPVQLVLRQPDEPLVAEQIRRPASPRIRSPRRAEVERRVLEETNRPWTRRQRFRRRRIRPVQISGSPLP